MQHLLETHNLSKRYGHLTGEENLRIIQTLKGCDRRAIDEVLKIVRLTDARKKAAGHYSLGMKQRLGLAAALLGFPKLLILDEPTNGLDPAGIQEMRELIVSLPEQYGITVLVSSHLLSEIDQMADHIGIISKGSLVYQDSLASLHAAHGDGVAGLPPSRHRAQGQRLQAAQNPAQHGQPLPREGALRRRHCGCAGGRPISAFCPVRLFSGLQRRPGSRVLSGFRCATAG